MASPSRISHAEFVLILRRAGYPQALIDEIAAQLQDPIDVDRDVAILRHYGLTKGHLMDMMGASP
jgi:hypothetical protein